MCTSINQPQSASLVVAILPKMPAGRKSTGQRKPGQKERCHRRHVKFGLPKLGHGVYVAEQSDNGREVRNLPRWKLSRRCLKLRQSEKAVKLWRTRRCLKLLKAEEDEALSKTVKSVKAEEDEDEAVKAEDEAVKAEDEAEFECNDDEDEDDDIAPDENNNEDWMTQLSRTMAKCLRHTAHKEGMLSPDDWVPLCDALPRLHCTAAQVTKAVQLSDRSPDEWGMGARFEMYISGSCTWIRATDVAYYRRRAQAQSMT